MSTAAPEMIQVQLDGEWIQVPKGTNAIEAAKMAGKFIPHYCYHPKLQIVGNCRMCLIEMGTPKMGPDRKPEIGPDGKPAIAWSPRPAIGCATNLSDGMGIRTDSPMVRDCRKGVMEFLLINHPLDCPICDQAGECKLQEFSASYGNESSRFVEEKVKKPKRVDIGERIMLDDERCVLCTRCIRFSRDVAGDDCIGILSRGSLNYLSVYPGKRLDNNYSLNTVDLCPVGALTSKDFRFKMRVWFLKETSSICTGCGTGCNVTIGAREGVVYRQTPRENEAVNKCWMCDRGRLDLRGMHDESRIKYPALRNAGELFNTDWANALDQAAERLKKFKPDQVAIIASAGLTNEELFLATALRNAIGPAAQLETVAKPQQADHLLVCDDGNPNTRGARLLHAGKGGEHLEAIARAVQAGQIQALLVFGEDLASAGFTPETLAKIPFVLASSILPNQVTATASCVLPAAAPAEKKGTMTNIHGRIQRLNPAVPCPAQAVPDWQFLAGLLRRLGGHGYESWESVFEAMRKDIPAFSDLTWETIGEAGIPVTV